MKGIDYTTDYFGSIKNDGIQQNIQQNLTTVNELVLNYC